jgi:hypothetical protein
MGVVGAGTIIIGLLATAYFTRVLGDRYRDQARRARGADDPDALPEQ